MGFLFPCNVCLLKGTLICKTCQSAFYCGQECQEVAWKEGHENVCIPSSTVESVPPKYHEEYKEVYPTDKKGYILLKKLYYISDERSRFPDAETIYDEATFDRRWFGNHEGGIPKCREKRLMKHKAGEILPGTVFLPKRTPYSGLLNFHNHPPMRLNYYFGETYVAMGCVDMFQLLIGEFRGQSVEPLSFFGIDGDLQAVARSLILLKMFEDKDTSTNSILQVWFSTVLDKEANGALKRAFTAIETTFAEPDTKAMVLLMSKKNAIEAKYAMENWQETFAPEYVAAPINALSSKCRVEYARYQMTGAIFCREDRAYCGNPTMTTEILGVRDNFFSIVDQACLREFKTGLMDTVESYYNDKAAKLKHLITGGKVDCIFRMCNLTFSSTDDYELAAGIRTEKPAVINWSNLPDYFHPKDLVAFAAACSVDTTLHIVHSMNWINLTYGVSFVDYAYLDGYKDNIKNMYEYSKNFISLARRSEIKKNPHLAEIFDYENAMDMGMYTIDSVLAHLFRKKYLDRFYGEGLNQQLKLVQVDEQCRFTDLDRMSYTVDFVLGNSKISEDSAKMLLKKYIC